MHEAAARDVVATAIVLLRADADVNGQSNMGYTPLHIAAVNGRDAMVKLLLQQPEIVVDMEDAMQSTSLACAARNGHTSIVQLLQSAKPASEVDICKTLFGVASQGHVETFQYLL